MANSKVRWNGTSEDGRTTSTIWGDNPFTWGDVSLAAEIAEVIDGVGYKRRKERLDDLFKDEDKKKRFIHLICRIKGEKVYDDKVEVKDVDVKVEDAELIKRLLARGKDSGRADDKNEDIIANRINEYNNKTAPLKEFYAGQNKLSEIEGTGSIEDIALKLNSVINSL